MLTGVSARHAVCIGNNVDCVEADKSPDYLRQVAERVRDFRDAFESLMELHTSTWRGPGLGLVPAVSAREDADETELQARRTRVAEAAGRARQAPRLTGVVYHVQGLPRPVDPIAAWATVTTPKPALEPENIIDACNQMIGHLDDLIARADAEAPPRVGVTGMHPLVWGAAKGLWHDGHYKQAVHTAADAVVQHARSITGRRDGTDTSLWQQLFSSDAPKPGSPRLRWPGDPSDQTVKTMNDGLQRFAPGVQMVVRNTATHGQDEMSEQEAAERLATLSLLARRVEECKLDEAPGSSGDGGA